MANILFWTSLFIILYTYCGYIAFWVILGSIFKKRIKIDAIFPYVSIIVACYNEEQHIRKKIENLLSLDYPKDKLQIIIASESTDRTNSIVSEYTSLGVQLIEHPKRYGKTGLLFNSIPSSNGEIIVFSDANVILKKDALIKITRNFADKKVGAVVGRVIINNPTSSSISFGENLYKRYETILRISSSRLGRVLNPDGALFAIRKDLYNPISAERGDDFELVIRVLIAGYDSIFEPEALCYEDASISAEAEITRKIRMVSWFIKSTLILTKEMFKKSRLDLVLQIISHKALRWLTPYFLITLLTSNIFLLGKGYGYLIFFIIQLTGYILGLISLCLSEKKKLKLPLLLRISGYFLMYNYAFAIGVSRGISERKPSAFWEIKRS